MTRNPGLRCSGISGGLDPAYTVRNAGETDLAQPWRRSPEEFAAAQTAPKHGQGSLLLSTNCFRGAQLPDFPVWDHGLCSAWALNATPFPLASFFRTLWVHCKGRDHHNLGFTMLMAGGGVKGGQIVGATDC